MTDALPTPPPPTVPLDEPIFGAATSYMQEHSDLQPEEIERVVLAFKTRHPTEYTASLGASTASSLPQAAGQATRAGEAAQARWQGGDASATRVLKAGRPISTAAADSSSWEAAAGLDCAEV
ncbi:hypothetical protein N2152v2_002425 [Parachlorella kessleri]